MTAPKRTLDRLDLPAPLAGLIARLPTPVRNLAPGLVLGALILTAGGSLTGNAVIADNRADSAEGTVAVVSGQRDQVARDLQEDATTDAALCATGGSVAATLDAAGKCASAAKRLSNPVVAAPSPNMTPEQVAEIVRKTNESRPAAASVEEVVTAVLERVRATPDLRGLNEAEVRRIVAAAMAEQNASAKGRDGASFEGLTFGRNEAGKCQATVTVRESDGSTSRKTAPAGDGACDPSSPAPKPTPEPTRTTEPEPTRNPSPTRTTEPEPTRDTPEPTSTRDDDGLLGN